jgi:hypothetical protein
MNLAGSGALHFLWEFAVFRVWDPDLYLTDEAFTKYRGHPPPAAYRMARDHGRHGPARPENRPVASSEGALQWGEPLLKGGYYARSGEYYPRSGAVARAWTELACYVSTRLPWLPHG